MPSAATATPARPSHWPCGTGSGRRARGSGDRRPVRRRRPAGGVVGLADHILDLGRLDPGIGCGGADGVGVASSSFVVASQSGWTRADRDPHRQPGCAICGRWPTGSCIHDHMRRQDADGHLVVEHHWDRIERQLPAATYIVEQEAANGLVGIDTTGLATLPILGLAGHGDHVDQPAAARRPPAASARRHRWCDPASPEMRRWRGRVRRCSCAFFRSDSARGSIMSQADHQISYTFLMCMEYKMTIGARNSVGDKVSIVAKLDSRRQRSTPVRDVQRD